MKFPNCGGKIKKRNS